MERYIPLLVFGLVALSIPILILVAARLLMLRRPHPAKYEAYECGNPVQTEAFAFRFSIRYMETVFLFPWAVTLGRLGVFGLVEMVVFLCILIVGYVYAYREGALTWA